MKQLEIFGVIAFDGIIRNGLRLHPDGEHLVYPMGNKVTCGNFIASGQVAHHGFKAMVIIWDYEKRKLKASYDMHKVRVEDVCFTRDERYLISLGGRDDGYIVVWDVQNGNPLCGSFAGKEMSGTAFTIARTNVHNASFISAGEGTFRVWLVNPKERKLQGIDVKIGKIRRDINCIAVDEKDEHIYCGTTSGDIIKARLNAAELHLCPIMTGCYSKVPRATKTKTTREEGAVHVYAGGVKNLLLLRKEKMIVGAGDGTIELIELVITDATPVRNGSRKLLVLPCIITVNGTTRFFSNTKKVVRAYFIV